MIRAADVGLTGLEMPDALDARPEVLAHLDEIRVAASLAMGVGRDAEEARRKRHVPFIAFLSPAAAFTATSGVSYQAEAMDFTARIISSGQPHRALPLTATLGLAIASRFEGSIAHEVAGSGEQGLIRIGMPSGILAAAASIEGAGADRRPASGSFFRTARRLFRGEVFAEVAE